MEAADATGDSYGYDDWGNLLSKTLTKGTAENLSVTVDVHNHVTSGGVVYDAAGNMTDDGLNTFAYNAENQMTSGAGKTFTYDGDGRRMSKSGYHLYWPDTGYSPLVETDFSGVMQREFIYFNGQKVALISSAGNPYYFLHDHLGSSSVMTSGTGLTVQAEYDFYPFGGERQITFQIDNRYRFTSYERDTESGNDYAVFRQYSSRLGRFLRADPTHGYVLDPQTLNRFSYVVNDPCNLTDPLGLSPCSIAVSVVVGPTPLNSPAWKSFIDTLEGIFHTADIDVAINPVGLQADFQVFISPSSLVPAALETDFGGRPQGQTFAFLNSTTITNNGAIRDRTAGMGLGRLAVHEIGHMLGLDDTEAVGAMHQTASLNSLYGPSIGWRFNNEQIARLQAGCKKLSSRGGPGNHGRSNALAPDWWAFMWFNSIGDQSMLVPDVTYIITFDPKKE